jgi:hypothetical protein
VSEESFVRLLLDVVLEALVDGADFVDILHESLEIAIFRGTRFVVCLVDGHSGRLDLN